jgi:hypothetical protein
MGGKVVMVKTIGLRQQVKQGLVTAQAALDQIQKAEFKNPTIVGWLRSRIDRGITVSAPASISPSAPAKESSKSGAKRSKIQKQKR